MIVLTILGALIPALIVPSPEASAALPEIGRVRANAVCTTLRRVAPTVEGLIKNDEIIGAGHRALAKMAHDAAGSSSGSIEIDKLYLEQVQTRLVHNLGVVDTILGDPKRFPAKPRTDDEREATALRDRLAFVAASQRKALDLVSGTLDTEALGQMQHDISTQMQSATAKTMPSAAATSDPVSFIGTAGLPDYEPVSGLPTVAAKTSTLAGHTIYDGIASALEETQTVTARREQVATTAVIGAVGECRATPTPRPTTTP